MNAIWHDSVVAEIHAVREHLAEQYQGDMGSYSAAAEAHCRALGLTMERGKMQTNSEVFLPTEQAIQE